MISRLRVFLVRASSNRDGALGIASPTAYNGTAYNGVAGGDISEAANETFCQRESGAMLSEVVQEAINQQINNELFSSYSYLSMSAWCDHKQFPGCAHWLRVQSQEEYGHAMRLHDFLLMRNARVVLKTITAPETDFESLVQVFEKALSQEQQVTEQIDSLYELAFQEKAFAALVELEWFITEQVEEEKTAREVVHKFHLVKDDPASLLDLDRDLGGRSAAPGE